MAKATQPSVILTDFLPKRLIVKIMPNDNSHTLIPKEKKDVYLYWNIQAENQMIINLEIICVPIYGYQTNLFCTLTFCNVTLLFL